jgi:hypothetical protein
MEEPNLERGVGRFSFLDDIKPRDPWDEPFYACVTGWFYLNPDSYADLLEEVRDGGYSDCRIEIKVTPVGHRPIDRVWDVTSHSTLFILEASVQFTRKVFEEKNSVEGTSKNSDLRAFVRV